ncbi:MAG: hypothetical protein WC752_00005, partial [Patescibacteria group bacterium]
MKKIILFLIVFLSFPLTTFSQEEYSLSLLERFTGEAEGDGAGWPTTNAGDVNGDGYDDFLVAAWGVNSYTGAVYLIYGEQEPLNGASLSTAVKFTGEAIGDMAGEAIGPAGDVNNDGYDDILVGATRNHNAGGADAGAAYLIYGKSEKYSGTASLGALGSDSAKFYGVAVNDHASKYCYSAGDVNGDGYNDFLIGVPNNDTGASNTGAAYLIYGKSEKYSGTTSLGALGSDSAKFYGVTAGDSVGYSPATAGDVNNDGYDDFFVDTQDIAGSNAGAVYLIYGKSEKYSGITALTALGGNGVKYFGEAVNDSAGYSSSTAGDVNNDGYADVIIGAFTNAGGGVDAGAAYLIYGQSEHLAGGALATAIKFTGEAAGDKSGFSVSSAGDINGDNFSDILIGADGWDEGYYTGAAYLGYLYIDSDLDSVAGTDGLFDGTDCNDSDATVSANQTYYEDNDDDGYGSTTSASLCSDTAPDNYASNNTDCSDTDETVNTNQTYYADLDNDSQGDSTNSTSVCQSTAPTGYVTNDDDINDNISSTTIPDQSWNEDNTTTITLSSYYTQRSDNTLTYNTVTSSEHITVDISGGIATLTPEENWYGTTTISFSAQDTGAAITSNTINLTVNSVNDTPNKVTSGFSPNNEEVGVLKPTLSWTAPTDADNTASELTYHVRVSTNSDPITNNQYSYTSNIGTASLKVTDALSEETTYYWAVRVSDPLSAKSDWSNIKSFTINTEHVPEITLSKTVTVSTEPFSLLNILIKQVNADTIDNIFFRKTVDWSYSIVFVLSFFVFLVLFFISLYLPNKKEKKSKRLLLLNRLSAVLAAASLIALIISLQLGPNTIAADDNGEAIEPTDYIQYTISASNTGDLSASNTIITDTIPTNTTLQSNTPVSSNDNTVITTNGNNIIFTTPSIGQDKTLTVSYVVKVNNPCTADSISSTAASFTSDEEVSSSSTTTSNPVESSTLSLTLNNTRGYPISNAKATLYYNNEKLLEATSNVSGQISFSGLSSGTYKVVLSGPSYYAFEYESYYTLSRNLASQSALTLSPQIVNTEQQEAVSEETEETTQEEEFFTVKIGDQEYLIPKNVKPPTTEEEKQAIKDQMELFLKLLMVNDQSVEDMEYFEAILSTVPGIEEYKDENGNIKTLIKVADTELVL